MLEVKEKGLNSNVLKIIATIIFYEEKYQECMSLLPKGKDLSKYHEIISFVISFEKASSYRIERGGYLRPTQYNDLIVHVYM